MSGKTRPDGKRFFILVETPVGWLGLVAGREQLTEIVSRPEQAEVRRCINRRSPDAEERNTGVLSTAAGQLEEYFKGLRAAFCLPLDRSELSAFAAGVLRTLAERVPIGHTVGYGELAAMAGRPGAARAVGRVMAANPFPIVVPCHRVVGSSGRLTGYSGAAGIVTKKWLLEFERGLRAKEQGDP